jgi:hypothetical protein
MNGWEALAEATEAEVVATPKVVEPVEELERVNEVEAQVIEEQAPVSSSEFISRFPELQAEMTEQGQTPKIEPSSTMLAFVGHWHS